TGVLAGTPLTVGATIDGSPVTSQPLPTIAVLAGAVAQVVVAPAAAALAALGQTQQFAAVAQDANGNVVPGQAFTWVSDNLLGARDRDRCHQGDDCWHFGDRHAFDPVASAQRGPPVCPLPRLASPKS